MNRIASRRCASTTRRGSAAVALATLATLATLCAACGSDGPETASGSSPPSSAVAGSLTVSAAASLKVPFAKIADAFKAANPGVTDVEINFDASSALAEQIANGAPADVFASADTKNMDKLSSAGLLAGSATVFARNELTIVVKKGNPKRVASLGDLANVGVVSLCGTEVPCGRYADQVLGTASVTIPPDHITRGQNVKATLAAVAEGDAEAGIVYVTDVTDAVDAVAIPESANVVATYPAGVIGASANQETAGAFVRFLTGREGQKIMKDAGFLPPA